MLSLVLASNAPSHEISQARTTLLPKVGTAEKAQSLELGHSVDFAGCPDTKKQEPSKKGMGVQEPDYQYKLVVYTIRRQSVSLANSGNLWCKFFVW